MDIVNQHSADNDNDNVNDKTIHSSLHQQSPKSLAVTMDQRMYGVNSPTLHHYPHNFPGSYGLPQTFSRQSSFSGVYSPGNFASQSFGYTSQASEWAAFTPPGSNFAVNGALGGASNLLAGRDSGDYFYQGGVSGGLTSPRGLVAGGTAYCEGVCPSSYSPQFSSSPSQSVSSSPASNDSIDKARNPGR